MGEKDGTGYVMRIGGNVSGQVAQGEGIHQTSVTGTATGPPEADLAALRDLVAELRATVAAQAPEEERDAALEQVDALHGAVAGAAPDLSAMNRVRNWFLSHLPVLAGAVQSVIISPVVAKVVEAAGDEAATAFHGLFG